MDRRTFLRTTAGFAALATVGALETEALASQAGLVRVRTHTVPFLGAVHWQGQHLRIAQLSDIHLVYEDSSRTGFVERSNHIEQSGFP